MIEILTSTQGEEESIMVSEYWQLCWEVFLIIFLDFKIPNYEHI